MAYVPQQQDDEDKRKLEAGGGALGSFGSTQGAAAPTTPKFVNVADYLSKNQEGSANIANAAAGKLEQQRDEAGGLVSGAGTKFNSDVSAGTTNLDQGTLDSALSSPETFVQDPNNTAKFLAMRDAAYKGPQSLQSTDYFAPADTKVKGLSATATGLGTEEGRNALVQSLSDHPTQGKTSLNQLLLQGNPESAQKIQDTAGTFKSIEDQWAQLLANAPSAVDTAKATTDATRTTTQGRLGDTTGQFKTGLNDKLGAANAERDQWNTNYTNLNNKLNNSANGQGVDLNQLDLDTLGIGDAFPYLTKLNAFNQDLSKYGGPIPLSTYVGSQGNANTNIPTLGGVASPEDYAREAALQQLSGQDLGLADTPEAQYKSNGKLPSGIDYKGAFGQAGTTLSASEADFLKNLATNYPQPGADSSDFYSKYYPATGHQATTNPAFTPDMSDNPYGNIDFQQNHGQTYNPENDYYTSVTAGNQNGQEAPTPPVYTPPGTTPTYPTPTSPQPTGQPPDYPGMGEWVWDTSTGQWYFAHRGGV